MYTFEFVVENIENKDVRLIIFEKEIDTGYRSVYNIYMSDVENINSTCRLFGDAIDVLECPEVKCLNENVNYGKAKRWSSKMKKIIETLVPENRNT
jgi:hypothetical protein